MIVKINNKIYNSNLKYKNKQKNKKYKWKQKKIIIVKKISKI